MKKGVCSVIIGIVYCAAFAIAQNDGGSISASRAEVVARIRKQIEVRLLEQNVSPDEQLAIIDTVDADLDAAASEILPDSLHSPSKNILELVLSVPLIISYRDKDYCRAVVRLYVYNVELRIKYLQVFPPLTSQHVIEIQESVSKLQAEVQKVLENELIPLGVSGLTKERIDNEVSGLLGRIGDVIGKNPFGTSLVTKLSDSDIKDFVVDFSFRLHDSAHLVTGIIRERGSSSFTDHDPVETVSVVLDEILAPVVQFVNEHTSDTRRGHFYAENIIAPGQKAVIEEYQSIVNRLMNERLQKRLAISKDDRHENMPAIKGTTTNPSNTSINGSATRGQSATKP